MNKFFVILILTCYACANSNTSVKKAESDLTAQEIMQKAHEKSGGEFWKRPKTLSLFGHAEFFKDGDTLINERHNMWRVFEDSKEEAHAANGKVRIESFRDSVPVFIVSFDGENTYDLNGKQAKSEADKRWASNFGFGVIRHAFDEGYKLFKMEDKEVLLEECYSIKILDPSGGETFFSIAKADFKIRQVAFDTPRGWHKRNYSEYFEKTEYNWLQSGKVELYYNEVKSNDVYWTDFKVNEKLDDQLFILQ